MIYFKKVSFLLFSILKYMKKELSWKLLIPLGLVLWLIGKFVFVGIVGSSLTLIGFIIGIMGIISLFKKK